MIVAGCLVVFAAVLGVIGVRAEMTRDEVHRSSNPCQRALGNHPTMNDVRECEQIRRRMKLTEPLADQCVIQRRTLKTGWYERITRCPPLKEGDR